MVKQEEKSIKEQEALHIELIRQMVTLSTSGFGLVAALAWNGVIQEFVNSYIKKWIPGGGIISLLIYAILVTIIAVLVTYNLSMTLKRLESLRERMKK